MTRICTLLLGSYLLILPTPLEALQNQPAAIAKQELMLYASVALTTAQAMAAAFERKQPHFKVQIYRTTSEQLVNRISTERRVGKILFDVAYGGLTMKPSEYIRRNCFVTCEVDEKYLPLAIDELGPEQICFATDYPHSDSEFPHTISKLRSRSDLTSRQKDLILGGNAARFLSL